MRPITVVRFWYGMSGFFVVAWVAKLIVALQRPTSNWRDAIAMPRLYLALFSLYWLERAHRKLKASPEAVIEISADRYLLTGLAVAVAVAVISFLIGFYTKQ